MPIPCFAPSPVRRAAIALVAGSCLLSLPARGEETASATPSTHAARLAAVKSWLEEDAALAESSELPELAASRRADLAALAAKPPAETTQAPPKDILPPIAQVEGNPVVGDFFKSLTRKILDPDKRFPKGPEGGKARTQEGWAFIVRANELHDLAQAFCHPQSQRAGDPALVAPILRRLAFFAEYMAPGGPVLGDFGPCGTIADAYLILLTTRPEILPPGIRQGMEQGLKNNAAAILKKTPGWSLPPGPTNPCLVNSDVNLVLALAITNRLFPDPAYADAVKRGLDTIEPHILPDGATNYFGQHNECPSYHGIAVTSLERTAEITGDARPREMVKRMRWYYPLVVSSTGVVEWASAPSWHHYWNTITGADAAVILAGLLDCPHNQRVANLGYSGDLWLASWWNPARPAAPTPDNYLTYDRNVEGPRGRYGPWSFVGTTRKTNDNRGKSSYVGCVIETGEPGSWPLDSALQDAGMEVRLDPTKDDVSEHRGRLALAHDEPITTSAVGGHAAALGAVARLGSYGRPPSNWLTRQAWLFTPERLVGLVTLEAGEESTAAGLFGTLFLVSGRANWGERKELQDLGNGTYSYGRMLITFHAQDFSGVGWEYIDVMGGGLNHSSAQKSCRLFLTDDAAKTGAETVYARGTRRFYLVEVRPASTAPARVTLGPADQGLLCFRVKEATDTYDVAFNPTDADVELPLARKGFVHRTGEKFRADWLKEAGPVESLPPQPSGPKLKLPAGEVAFISDR